ncbi:hypothetical protein [Novipirellula rosea]
MNRRALHRINTAISITVIDRRRLHNKYASVGGCLGLNANQAGGGS